MTDAQLYSILVDRSIAYNKERGLDIDTAPDNPYSVAARQILHIAIENGTLSKLFDEVDAIREAEKARN